MTLPTSWRLRLGSEAARGVRERPGLPLTLIAVTAKSNRSKSDKDPAQWLPPADDYRCQYAAEWTATKLRWDLAADGAEHKALFGLAAECRTTTVYYETAS